MHTSTQFAGVVLAPITCYVVHTVTLRGDTGLVLVALLSVLLFCYALYSAQTHVLEGLVLSSTSALLHLGSVGFLTLLYRTSPFHPLHALPGPFLYKFSSLVDALSASTGKRHISIRALHEKYGTVVRIGPNNVSINSQSVILPIYAQAKSMDRSNAYVLGREKNAGLFFIPQRQPHNQRRNIWASAFIPSAIDSYVPRVEQRARQLVDCITTRSEGNSPVNLWECLQHWGYDTMGDVVFGGVNRIELMAHGDPYNYVQRGQSATASFEILGNVPWLLDILWYLSPTQDLHALERLAEELMRKRKKEPQTEHSDLCAHLLGEVTPLSKPLTDGELTVDALFAIQAGSDSTASVMTFAVYFLLQHPAKLECLLKELRSSLRPGEVSPGSRCLLDLPYLNAVLHESLRLGTPFPGLPRVVPEEGLMAEGYFLPAGTIVNVPAYSQQVSPDNFSPEPMSFIPERWLDDEGGTTKFHTRRNALMCFSYGAFSCLGRQLAIHEMRIALTQIVLRLDLSFADNFDADRFLPSVTAIKTTVFNYPLLVKVQQR